MPMAVFIVKNDAKDFLRRTVRGICFNLSTSELTEI